MEETLNKLTAALAERAGHYDETGAWPTASLNDFAGAGGWRWGVPKSYGGEELAAGERLKVYAALARGCMNTALYVTQHESALDLIVNSDNEPLKERVLPAYARGEGLTTIGYAQLTTSHQDGEPVLRARLEEGGITVEGFMPWVTGAGKVETVAAGAVLPDGQQVVVLLPFAASGVEVEPPMKLLALDAAHTCVVRCHGVRLPLEQLVAGPLPQVLARRSSIRRLSVSATGSGLLAAMADCMAGLERRAPSALGSLSGEVERCHLEIVARLDALAAEENAEKQEIDVLRGEINALLVRCAGVLMTMAKGTGYRRDQTAQRLAREALFFCVWSAQDPVRQTTVQNLLGSPT